jgi:dihydrofolate reductase
MGKLIVQQFMTLDGVMQAPGDATEFERGGWQKPYVCEEQLTCIVRQAFEADALLLGRKTYEGFAAAWPSMTSMQGLADRMNSMPKFVASRSLKQVEWNATLLGGNVVEEIIRLKNESGRSLLTVGSGNLTQTLMKHDLIDEYRIWFHPVVLGCGERLFREGGEKFDLSLVDVKTTGTGAVILTYRRG